MNRREVPNRSILVDEGGVRRRREGEEERGEGGRCQYLNT